MPDKIYVGDTPEIRLTLGISLSGASVVKFFIRKPDGSIKSYTPTVEDEAEGILTYQVATTDFDQAGSYRIRPRVAFAGGNRYSGEPVFIDVEDLDADEKPLT